MESVQGHDRPEGAGQLEKPKTIEQYFQKFCSKSEYI